LVAGHGFLSELPEIFLAIKRLKVSVSTREKAQRAICIKLLQGKPVEISNQQTGLS
jgi:hypothetical protein